LIRANGEGLSRCCRCRSSRRLRVTPWRVATRSSALDPLSILSPKPARSRPRPASPRAPPVAILQAESDRAPVPHSFDRRLDRALTPPVPPSSPPRKTARGAQERRDVQRPPRVVRHVDERPPQRGHLHVQRRRSVLANGQLLREREHDQVRVRPGRSDRPRRGGEPPQEGLAADGGRERSRAGRRQRGWTRRRRRREGRRTRGTRGPRREKLI